MNGVALVKLQDLFRFYASISKLYYGYYPIRLLIKCKFVSKFLCSYSLGHPRSCAPEQCRTCFISIRMKHFPYFYSRVLLNFPGFKSFDVHDQMILLRLAQSQSRILAAALAWFNSDSQTFTDFLPWRELKPGQVDLFQELLTDYAKNVQNRNLDPVESALFNIVVVIATGEQVPSSQQQIAARKRVVLGLHCMKLALCTN